MRSLKDNILNIFIKVFTPVGLFQKAGAIIFILLPSVLFGQKTVATTPDTVILDGFINADQTLTPDKVYVVKYNTKVGKNAMLTVNAGTKILFETNTALVLEGGITLNGAPNNFIHFTSLYPSRPGTGILVRGNEGKDIKMQYTLFSDLMIPLRFESEWYRRNVSIEKNVFTRLYTGESNILITSPVVSYRPGTEYIADFSFSNNAFYDNWGSIFIENFEDNILRLKFNNNLITNNVVYGIDIGIPSNTPVFGLYDDQKKEYKMQMENNSIFGNYQINSSADTIIREISVGIQGDGEEFRVPNNFFRSENPDYVSSTFDHFYQNSDLPLLRSEPLLSQPKEETPPHVFRVNLNGREIKNYDELPELDVSTAQFDVYFNKPVTVMDGSQMLAVSYDTISRTLLRNEINLTQTKWSPDRKVFSFNVNNPSFLKNPYAYVLLTNFKDQEGFIVPDFHIGRRQAINNLKRSDIIAAKTADVLSGRQSIIDVDVDGEALLPDKKTVENIESLTDLGALSALGPYRSLTKTWEVGITAGVSNYFGTLTYGLMDRNDFNFAIGAFGQYNLNKWFSFRAMIWYGKISGNDFDDDDPDRKTRLLNFKNNIIEGSLTAHWHLLKYGTSRGEKFTPTIFAGIGIFRNKPMGRIFLYEDTNGDPIYLTYQDGQYFTNGQGEDVWISLREIGTEGQTTAFGVDPESATSSPYAYLYADREAPKQYKKVQLSFPIGMSLDYIIYNKWVISVEVGVRVTTTKYLDDVSGYYWDRGSLDKLDPYGLPGTYPDPLVPDTGVFSAPGYHQSIVDANPEVFPKGISDALPQTITVVDPITGIESQYNTVALLANPSLVLVDENLYEDNGVLVSKDSRINPNQNKNQAFTYGDGRKANPNAFDHFAFVGVKISKVIDRRGKKGKGKSNIVEF